MLIHFSKLRLHSICMRYMAWHMTCMYMHKNVDDIVVDYELYTMTSCMVLVVVMLLAEH